LIWFITLSIISGYAVALPPGIRHYKEPVEAPVFSLRDTEDRIHDISDYKGRVLVLNFWATWCIPCRKEMPALKKAWSRLRTEGIQLLGVATRDEPDMVLEYKKKYDLKFPLPLDQDGAVAGDWAVMAVPTAYVINRDGRIAIRVIGGKEWDSYELIDSIIRLNQPANSKVGLAEH
jgi:peroxiredoxin